MMVKFFRWFSGLLVLLGIALAVADAVTKLYSQEHVINATIEKGAGIPKQKFIPQFTREKEGLHNAVYITMVKDEDDIIYENLVWHFAVGFRKFIIFDNNSTDNTPALIKRFADETKDIATVLVVQDPIVEHSQNRIITGGCRMAHELWPEVEWFFPVDADEFWVFSQDPAKALAMIPDNIDAGSVIRARYYPSDDYDLIPKNQGFWHRLHYRDNQWAEFDSDRNRYVIVPKVFLRYSNNYSVVMGNHQIAYHGILAVKGGEDDTMMYYHVIDNVRYAAADLYGIHLREYHMRSPEQTHKKFTNGLNSAIKSAHKKQIGLRAGVHWFDYKKSYLDKAKTPEEAAANKFKSYYRRGDNVMDDPLQMDDAIALYKQLLK